MIPLMNPQLWPRPPLLLAEALTKVQLPSKLAIQVSQEDSSRREDARAIQRDPLKPDAVPPSKPMLEEGQDPTTAPEAGDKPGGQVGRGDQGFICVGTPMSLTSRSRSHSCSLTLDHPREKLRKR